MTNSRPSYVYFIKPVGMDGPIKIGCSGVPEQRLLSLAMWSPFPLEIIVTIKGGIRLEKNIHECFSYLHSHHEWFAADDRLISAIDLLKRGVPVELAIDLSDRRGSIARKKPGGANWSDITRQKMGVLNRVRFAMKRKGLRGHCDAPAKIRNLMNTSERRILTDAEMSLIIDFCKSSFSPNQTAMAGHARGNT